MSARRRPAFLSLLFGCALAPALAQEGQASPPPAPQQALESDDQKMSYALGQRIGTDLLQGGVELDLDALCAGLRDALAKKGRMSQQEVEAAFRVLQQRAMEAERKTQAAASEKNLSEGRAYLEQNKAREGVTVLPSGLQYEVIRAGDGPSPKATDRVVVHYRGTLIDGTEFDSSYSRGQPARFPVNGVIKGWTEALQLMKTGAKWKLYIPSDLAYGANPRPGGPIGPNAVLVFEVELLGIE